MKDLIKALIENDKPFGLMSAEMQAKAIEIGLLDNFRMYTGSITGEWGGIFKATWCKFRCDVTYCLRADYQEKADIVEREICENCRWWTEWDVPDTTRGYFHKQSPVIVSDRDAVYSSVWPDTKQNDFCGNWESK